MVDPVNEDGAGLVAHPLGENSGKAILFKEGGDALEQEIFGLVAERPVELIFRLVGHVESGCAHIWSNAAYSGAEREATAFHRRELSLG